MEDERKTFVLEFGKDFLINTKTLKLFFKKINKLNLVKLKMFVLQKTLLFKKVSWARWHSPIISALGR